MYVFSSKASKHVCMCGEQECRSLIFQEQHTTPASTRMHEATTHNTHTQNHKQAHTAHVQSTPVCLAFHSECVESASFRSVHAVFPVDVSECRRCLGLLDVANAEVQAHRDYRVDYLRYDATDVILKTRMFFTVSTKRSSATLYLINLGLKTCMYAQIIHVHKSYV
jgi:hypothetical protein